MSPSDSLLGKCIACHILSLSGNPRDWNQFAVVFGEHKYVDPRAFLGIGWQGFSCRLRRTH